MSKISPENGKPVSAIGAAGLSLSALGVVFGDIGTSPLYTLKTVLGIVPIDVEIGGAALLALSR